jgi:hypothetical protein
MKPAVPPVQVPVGRVVTPLHSGGSATPTSSVQGAFSNLMEQEKRGKKRERDDTGSVAEGVNGVGAVNGGVNMNPPKAILNAKAGMAGIRPRPIKKLRMVSLTLYFAIAFLVFRTCLVAFTHSHRT